MEPECAPQPVELPPTSARTSPPSVDATLSAEAPEETSAASSSGGADGEMTEALAVEAQTTNDGPYAGPGPSSSLDTPAAPTPPAAESTSTTPLATLPPTPSTSDCGIVPLISISPSDPSKSRTFYAKYFLPVEHDAPLRAALDLPESYFAPTPSELQAAFAGQVAKREKLVDGPLLTQKLRDREEATKNRAKAARWPQTRIRIRFSDRSQLEGVFPSTDKMVHIYEFLRLAIAEEHRGKAFVVYQSPPRVEFRKGDPAHKGKSLMELQLTPSSVFYIKWDDEQLNAVGRPPLIRELLGAAAQFPLPPAFDPRAQEQQTAAAEPKPKMQKLGFGGQSGKVTPSWLKLGKSGKK